MEFIGNKTAQRQMTIPPKGHAFLLLGGESVGKATLALNFAAKLLCENSNHCGECRECRKVEANTHPDLIVTEAVSIEEIRTLLNSLSVRPIGSYRVTILNDADSLSIEAQNALLKTLEEPGEGDIVILLAKDEHALLPTINSRCQKISLRNVPKDVIEKELRQRGASADEAAAISSLANGRPGKAITVFTEKRYQKTLEELAASMGSLGESLPMRFTFVERAAKDPGASRDHLADLAIFFRAVLLSRFEIANEIIPQDFVERFDPKYGVDKLLELLARITKAQEAVQSKGNIRLSLESLHYQMSVPK